MKQELATYLNTAAEETNREKRLRKRLSSDRNRLIRVYDKSNVADRYTVVYLKREEMDKRPFFYRYVGMDNNPLHPQGFCQHGDFRIPLDRSPVGIPRIGHANHMGRRIRFTDLPAQCQMVVLKDLKE